MRSDQALRYIKNFMRECMDCYDKWMWQKNKINEATCELLYYYSRCNEEDKQEAWKAICGHGRMAERVSQSLAASQGGTGLQ